MYNNNNNNNNNNNTALQQETTQKIKKVNYDRNLIVDKQTPRSVAAR